MQLLNNLFKVLLKRKNADMNCYKLTSLVSLWQENVKKSKNFSKLMKIGNIDREILHIFWTTWELQWKFQKRCDFQKRISEKNIKSHKNPVFHSFFRRYILGKTTGGGGVKLTPSPQTFRVKNTFLIQYVRFWILISDFIFLRNIVVSLFTHFSLVQHSINIYIPLSFYLHC